MRNQRTATVSKLVCLTLGVQSSSFLSYLQVTGKSCFVLHEKGTEITSIRQTKPEDDIGIWTILEPMIRSGETYALPRSLSCEEALAYWHGAGNTVFVAEDDSVILGT
ncbi:MAG: hypothetical protein JO028_00380 [Acidobacteriaceae bacterium]|nr:hypothetical protein [Acidobacteriaceae bacterium]